LMVLFNLFVPINMLMCRALCSAFLRCVGEDDGN